MIFMSPLLQLYNDWRTNHQWPEDIYHRVEKCFKLKYIAFADLQTHFVYLGNKYSPV